MLHLTFKFVQTYGLEEIVNENFEAAIKEVEGKFTSVL